MTDVPIMTICFFCGPSILPLGMFGFSSRKSFRYSTKQLRLPSRSVVCECSDLRVWLPQSKLSTTCSSHQLGRRQEPSTRICNKNKDPRHHTVRGIWTKREIWCVWLSALAGGLVIAYLSHSARQYPIVGGYYVDMLSRPYLIARHIASVGHMRFHIYLELSLVDPSPRLLTDPTMNDRISPSRTYYIPCTVGTFSFSVPENKAHESPSDPGRIASLLCKSTMQVYHVVQNSKDWDGTVTAEFNCPRDEDG